MAGVRRRRARGRLPLPALDSISPEPGFGFVTLVPHPEAGEDDLPEEMIVPVAILRRIELARAEEHRAALGLSVRPGGLEALGCGRGALFAWCVPRRA